MRILILGTTLLLVVLAACSPVSTVTPVPPIQSPTLAPPAATSAASTGLGSAATQAAQPATVAPPPANAGPVALQVLSPADGAVVNTQPIALAGTASPGAVISVNDDILIAGADGQFHDTVQLTEGPNVIEIIASDTSGSEASLELTVTYEP